MEAWPKGLLSREYRGIEGPLCGFVLPFRAGSQSVLGLVMRVSEINTLAPTNMV